MNLHHRIPWAALVFLAAACVPWLGSRFYTFLATDIAILALFAVSLNLLLGYTGLVSFGHAAYFGIGAYTCAILMKTHGVPFALGLVGAAANAGFWALLFGVFCVRSTKIYFSMLTLAFGILIVPGFSIFAVFALMALVLVLRPSGLLGRAVKR